MLSMICILRRCQGQHVSETGIQNPIDPSRALTWYIELLCQPLAKGLSTEHTLVHADAPHRDEGANIQSAHARVLSCGKGGRPSPLQISTLITENHQLQVVGSSSSSQAGLLGMPQDMGTMVAMAGIEGL